MDNIDNQIKSQIKFQMRRAFWDLLSEKVASDPPDINWLVRLYAEVGTRLKMFAGGSKETKKKIDEVFDKDLFDQMIRNDAFDADDLVRLINTTFELIASLQSPARDEILKQKKDEVLQKFKNGATVASVVPSYLKASHELMDFIEDDLKTVMEHAQPASIK